MLVRGCDRQPVFALCRIQPPSAERHYGQLSHRPLCRRLGIWSCRWEWALQSRPTFGNPAPEAVATRWQLKGHSSLLPAAVSLSQLCKAVAPCMATLHAGTADEFAEAGVRSKQTQTFVRNGGKPGLDQNSILNPILVESQRYQKKAIQIGCHPCLM